MAARSIVYVRLTVVHDMFVVRGNDPHTPVPCRISLRVATRTSSLTKVIETEGTVSFPDRVTPQEVMSRTPEA